MTASSTAKFTMMTARRDSTSRPIGGRGKPIPPPPPSSTSLAVRSQQEIARDDDSNGEAGPDGKGRLNVELPLYDLLSGLADAVGGPLPDCLGQVVFAVVGPGFGADAQVNEEKTRICKVPDGEFDFLGYSFGRMYSA